MSKVKVTYLEANGVYRNKTAKIERDLPTLVTNKKDQMRHTITENPIWSESKPVKLNSFPELESMLPPIPPEIPGRLRMICEDNSFYPVSANSIDYQRRYFERNATKETGYQRARAKASKINENSGIMSAMAFALIGVVVVCTLLLGLLVVINLNKDEAPAPTTNKTEKAVMWQR